jgi:hypothetical protein
MEEMRIAKFWSENLKGRDHLEDLVLEKRGGKMWNGLMWLRIRDH